MKNRNKELDVDFIGGQLGLSKAEEIAISNYFKSQKVKKSQRESTSKLGAKLSLRKKAIA